MSPIRSSSSCCSTEWYPARWLFVVILIPWYLSRAKNRSRNCFVCTDFVWCTFIWLFFIFFSRSIRCLGLLSRIDYCILEISSQGSNILHLRCTTSPLVPGLTKSPAMYWVPSRINYCFVFVPFTLRWVVSHTSWIVNVERKLSNFEGWKLNNLLSGPADFPSPNFTNKLCRFSANTLRRSARLGMSFCSGLMDYHCASDSFSPWKLREDFLEAWARTHYSWSDLLGDADLNAGCCSNDIVTSSWYDLGWQGKARRQYRAWCQY